VNDNQIVDLFFERNEEAIEKTREKYSKLLLYVAGNILSSREDSEEIENDTYLTAWNTIPPKRPERLGAYLSKITRNLAINRYNFNSAGKRNKNLELALYEMEEFLPSEDFEKDETSRIVFKECINKFLRSLNFKKRAIFIMRYYYLAEIKEISEKLDLKESNVKVILLRLRDKFKKELEREGLHI
jgi:RNA polymerase sigma-70 factor (ECF subfamily)